MSLLPKYLRLAGTLGLIMLLPAMARLQNLNDTLKLPEFEIRSNFVLDNQGFKRTRIDSTILVSKTNADLARILSNHSTIFIKSYGNGTLATSSFRGTAAQHTQVEWNGITLNSPMLGQIDLSQVRVSQFDNLEILYGAAGISRTSGAFGGVIDLVTGPNWNNRLDVMAAQTIGSFDTYATNLNVAAGDGVFQSHTKLNYASSLNDFPYMNDTGEVRQKHASYKNYDFSQEVFFRIKSRHVLSAKVWYNKDDRNLPATLTNPDPDHKETQQDEALRAILEYKYVHRDYNILARSAVVDQAMHYFNEGVADARYRCYSWINKIRFNYSGIKNFVIKPGVDLTYDRVNAESYNGLKTRTTASLFAEVAYTPWRKFKTSLVLREDMVDGVIQPLVPALGLEYRPLAKINLAVTMNLSRNYRYPTLNDLYWQIYGNTDLKTERNYSAEIGTTWNTGEKNRAIFAEISLAGYYSQIHNMITWLPDRNSSLYRPINVPEVLARGIEAGLDIKWKILGFNLDWVTNYNFCRSTYQEVNDSLDDKRGKQLIYIPVHTLNSTISLERWKFYLHYNFYYTSDRYTGNDNLSYMPAYYLSNIILGKNIGLNKFILSLQVEINNLFDLDYQSMANRPMPGINYAFTVKLAMPGLSKE